MKIGIIGLGRVFDHYVKNFLSDSFFQRHALVLCDIDKIKLNKYHSIFNCPTYNSLEGIIKEKPDFVIVSTPSGYHYEHSKTLLSENINVLTEKPVCMNTSELRELIDLSKVNKIKYGVIFQNRLNPAIKKLKQIYELDILGKINICSVRLHWAREQSYYEDEWHGRWKMDGGVINQQAIHHIDAMQWINGPVKEVSAMEGNMMNKLEAEDTMIACMKFSNNSMGTIEATTSFRPKDYEASLIISGSKGYVSVGGIALNKIVDYSIPNASEKLKTEIEKSSEDVETGYGNSHKEVITEFIKSIENNNEFTINAESTLQTTQLVHALYRSIEKSSLCKVNSEESIRLGK